MPGFTRRRVPEARNEASRIFYGDVPTGTIGVRAGVPVDVATIRTSCSNCERRQRADLIAKPVHRHGPGV